MDKMQIETEISNKISNNCCLVRSTSSSSCCITEACNSKKPDCFCSCSKILTDEATLRCCNKSSFEEANLCCYSTEGEALIKNITPIKDKVVNDKSSNFNIYKKEKKEKIFKKSVLLRDKIEYLKKFKPKFIKRENMDKRIIRNFRKFLIDSNKIKTLTISLNSFWEKFIKENLLPPMEFIDENQQKISYKSYNTNFMIWLFSKNKARELFEEFLKKKGDLLLSQVIENSVKDVNRDNKEEFNRIKEYINYIPQIYMINTNQLNDYEIQIQDENVLMNEESLDIFKDDNLFDNHNLFDSLK